MTPDSSFESIAEHRRFRQRSLVRGASFAVSSAVLLSAIAIAEWGEVDRLIGLTALAVLVALTTLEWRRVRRSLGDPERRAWFLALVAERTSQPIVIADRSTLLVWCNEAFAGLVGRTPAELGGRSVLDLLSGSHADCESLDRIQESLERSGEIRCDVALPGEDGLERWFELETEPLRRDVDASGGEATVSILRLAEITARRAERAALESALEFNCSVLDSVDAQVAVVSSSGRILSVNRRWGDEAAKAGRSASIVGAAVGQDLLARCREAGETTGAAAALTALESVLTGREDRATAQLASRRDESSRWFNMSVVALGGTEGRARGAIVTHVDVTDLKRVQDESAERARTEAAIASIQSRFLGPNEDTERFAHLIESVCALTESPRGVVAVANLDGDGAASVTVRGVVDASGDHTGTRSAGIEDDPVLGKLLTRVLERRALVLERSVDGGAGALGVPILRGRDLVGILVLSGRSSGYDATVIDRLEPLHVPLAEVLGAWILDHGRRGAELALRESEARHRLVIDRAMDAVISIDERGIVRTWNHQAERVFGWSAEEALGRELGTLIIPPDLRQSYVEGLVRCVGGGTARRLNRRVQTTAFHRSGHEFPVEISVSPLQLADGRHFFAFLRDITDAKRAERDLVEARERALEVASAKGLFLATMSHEIRTPMNGVLGMAALLRETKLDAEQADLLRTIHQSGEALLSIINDILDYSKVEAGQMRLERRPFDLRQLVSDVRSLLLEQATRKGLELDLEIDDSVPRLLRGDLGRIRQVLINLAGNALKFTEGGGVTIEVRTVGLSSAIACVRCVVSDTGLGMAEDVISRLFEPFSQADASMSRRFGGTGLGLAISRRIVELMGGEINVASEIGVGSRFWFDLSLPVATETPDAETPPEGSVFGEFEGPPRHILVVEDNVVNQKVVRRMLERMGCIVEVAENGQQAILRQRETRYDLIFMDCQMPVLDGLAATRSIREEERVRDAGERVSIVALTANALLEDREACLAAGMDGYLAKPIQPRALRDALRIHARPASPVLDRE